MAFLRDMVTFRTYIRMRRSVFPFNITIDMGLIHRKTAAAIFLVRAPTIGVAEAMLCRLNSTAACAGSFVVCIGVARITVVRVSLAGGITAQTTVLLMRVAAILVFEAMRDHSGIAAYSAHHLVFRCGRTCVLKSMICVSCIIAFGADFLM